MYYIVKSGPFNGASHSARRAVNVLLDPTSPQMDKPSPLIPLLQDLRLLSFIDFTAIRF